MAVLLQFNEQLSFSVQQIQSNTGKTRMLITIRFGAFFSSIISCSRRHQPRPTDSDHPNSTESKDYNEHRWRIEHKQCIGRWIVRRIQEVSAINILLPRSTCIQTFCFLPNFAARSYGLTSTYHWKRNRRSNKRMLSKRSKRIGKWKFKQLLSESWKREKSTSTTCWWARCWPYWQPDLDRRSRWSR